MAANTIFQGSCDEPYVGVHHPGRRPDIAEDSEEIRLLYSALPPGIDDKVFDGNSDCLPQEEREGDSNV